MAALIAAIVTTAVLTAACPLAQAAGPFPEEIIRTERSKSHLWAYTSLAAGVGLIAGSFLIADDANDTYEEYLASTDPSRISDLYDDTVRKDRLASATLIGGEVLVAVGLYLRFLRPEAPVRVSLGPSRCALAFRF